MIFAYFFANLAFLFPWQPIKFSGLDKIHMVGRGLLNGHFCKTFVKLHVPADYGILWKVNQIIYIVYPNCMPDTMILAQALFTRLLYYTKCQRQKKEIIQSKIYIILPKVNQVIVTNLWAKYHDPQAVLQIFCSQGPLWVKGLNLKRGIIQSNINRILWKVNQVIYIMYPNSMPDIRLLAQAILRMFGYFVHKVALLYKMPKSGKGDNSVYNFHNFAKS